MKRLLPCLLAALAGSWEVDDQGRLTASLQVATLDPATRRLDVPEGARIWLEVGTNSRNWLANCELLCEGYDDVYIDGCSALAKPIPGERACATVGGVRRVPTMTLKSVFDVLLPVGAHVDFLYVDAQGHGLKILEGAGDSLARVDAIVVDALLRDEALMYETQNGCAAAVEFAARRGLPRAL
ncbi:methyltransferase [Aureococcus anophagefferens]|uniref:Methyltransferase n=1 Tax=Aureococcus anophagefferens TaxID=44056 RepID=A0ABR1FJJ4_AURAN